MSVGSQGSKQKSSSASYSSPISVDAVKDYWYGLDSLTGGGYKNMTQTPGYWAGGSGGADGSDILTKYRDGSWYVGDAAPWYGAQFGGDSNQASSGSYVPGTTNYGSYTPGRLSKWATEGTPEVEYQGLTADDLAAVGGAGQTRLLTARQAYGDRGSEIASDPSMTLAQRQYSGGQNTRELWNTEDAVASEVEAALTELMSEEASRKYQADIRNADLAKSDLETLAAIYASLIGNTTSSSSTGSGSSSGFNFGLWKT